MTAIPQPKNYLERTVSGRTAIPVEIGKPHSWRFMGKIGISMLLHDRLKLAGTLAGVVFAVLLSNFQTAIFFGLLLRNTMYVDRSDADIWIVPPGTTQLQGGDGTMPDNLVSVARGTKGVEWAAPLLMGGASVKVPTGGQKPMTVIGVELPKQGTIHGGPFHVVKGDPMNLAIADSLFFEDTRRERLGNVNLGSIREVNGHDVQAVGFTYGLIPFGPVYAFGSFDTARELLGRPDHEINYLMVGVRKGEDVGRIQADLQKTFPEQLVLTRSQVHDRTVSYVLGESGIGGTIGSGVAMSVICGFVIVALTMFSAVVEKIREFGTLKAIGATNRDLAKLLVVQAVTVAVTGVMIGETVVHWFFKVANTAETPLGLPAWVLGATLGGMILMCVAASTLALMRVRSVEPAMVFRG